MSQKVSDIAHALQAAQEHHLAGRLNEAERIYRAAIALDPHEPVLPYNLGNTLKVAGRLEEAEHSYRAALALKPDFVEAHNNRGIVLADLGRFDEAERSYREALVLRPVHTLAHNNLGNLLRELGRHEEAEQCYRRAIELNPELAEAYDHHGNSLLDLGRLDEADRSHRRAVALAPAQAAIRSNLLLTQNYLPGRTPEQIFAEHREFERIFPSAVSPNHSNSADPERRLRVGYVSGDFRVHSVATFFEPALAQHDRGKFETFCYYHFPRADAVTLRLRGLADHWRDVHTLDDEALARRVREDAIDILVDLSGHTGKNRLPLFARKPAPVQATWLGYPATTGLSAIDWRITDAVSDPERQGDRFFSERLIRLPHAMWCLRPDEQLPAVAPSPAAGAGVTFGSCNYFAKVNSDVIALWAKLLTRLPQARLVLTRVPGPGTAQALRERFAREGVVAERIELHGILSREKLGELLGRVDVALDPFPYAGTTTTCDMLWMGIPVVTLAGATTASRSGASLLHAISLDQLVAHSKEQYVAIAEGLARDPARLGGLRAGLRGRMRASPLMDAAGFTRSLESAYQAMWREWCSRRGVQASPNRAEPWFNVGVAAAGLGQYAQAVEGFCKAIALNPQMIEAFCALGAIHQLAGNLESSVTAWRGAISINPARGDLHRALASALGELGMIDDALASVEKAIELSPEDAAAQSMRLFLLNYSSRHGPEAVLEEHARWAAERAPAAAAPYPNERAPARRLRIGYVSPDFREHPIAFFVAPVLACHDRKKFEVFCYSDVREPDSVTLRLRQSADIWREIAGIADAQVAERVAADGIDVLVDLALHSGHNRMQVFARKPAPVQATWLGYAGTTGLSQMDYKITDPILDPPGRTEQFHAETLLRLPDCYWCYTPPPGCPEVGLRRPSGAITFCAFQNLAKVSPSAIELWAKVLRAVPRSRLIVKARGLAAEATRARLCNAFAAHGIGEGRLVLENWSEMAGYLARFADVDIGLDTTPFSGGTTTCHALWMGVPVVTLAGASALGRMGVSILQNIGLDELIAASPAEFVSIAAHLAADSEALAGMRHGLRARMAGSPMTDAARFTRNLEAAYRDMWSRWCASEET